MPGKIPDKIHLYRIVHVKNLSHILKYGLCSSSHANADPAYTRIGDII